MGCCRTHQASERSPIMKFTVYILAAFATLNLVFSGKNAELPNCEDVGIFDCLDATEKIEEDCANLVAQLACFSHCIPRGSSNTEYRHARRTLEMLQSIGMCTEVDV